MTKQSHPPRRLLIFQETRNPQNTVETVYLPVNKLGLPICGEGPELPSILELPLRILNFFTETFNQSKYKGWYVLSSSSSLAGFAFFGLQLPVWIIMLSGS